MMSQDPRSCRQDLRVLRILVPDFCGFSEGLKPYGREVEVSQGQCRSFGTNFATAKIPTKYKKSPDLDGVSWTNKRSEALICLEFLALLKFFGI
jgi:hypothetical protein